MPQRNVYKDYLANSYYHIYNRGANKSNIFLDEQDYVVFLGLLKRYLGNEVYKKASRENYHNFHKDIELLAFCLMPNHFHLFIYQKRASGMTDLLKSLSISYVMYFNKKYKRLGPLFQQRYKAVSITDDAQLLHITRYIHMNPDRYTSYKWSSLSYYTGDKESSWVRPGRIKILFAGEDYMKFLGEYKNYKRELDKLKHELADA